jgi:WD40 repeat protein
VARGKPRGEPIRPDDDFWSMAFSADGSTLATANWDKTARLWDVPPPAADEPEGLWLSIEVRTWHTLENGLIRP